MAKKSAKEKKESASKAGNASGHDKHKGHDHEGHDHSSHDSSHAHSHESGLKPDSAGINQQEQMIRAQLMQQELQQMDQQLQMIDQQIVELQLLSVRLEDIEKAELGSQTLASVGKNVYIQTELKGKELFVDVGAGVVVKKKPEEVKKIIDKDVKKLIELRTRLNKDMQDAITDISSMQLGQLGQ